MSTRILVHLIFCFFKILSAPKVLLLRSRITLRYYLDLVTLILSAPSLQTYVMPRAVKEQTVTQSRRQAKLAKVQCFKMAKIDPVSPFYPILWLKKAIFAKGKPTRRTKNEPSGCIYLFMCVSKLEVFTQCRQFIPPAYRENSCTSMVSYRDFLPLPKPIPRYILNECLNVWFKLQEENLELYHMLNIAVENE